MLSAHFASAEEDGGWEGLSVCTLKLGQVRGFAREPGWFVGGARSILLEVGSLVRRVVVGVSGDSEGCRRVDPGVGGPLDEFFFFLPVLLRGGGNVVNQSWNLDGGKSFRARGPVDDLSGVVVC